MKAFPTPENIVTNIIRNFRPRDPLREYWSIAVGAEIFHGLYTEKQAEKLGQEYLNPSLWNNPQPLPLQNSASTDSLSM